MSPNSHPLPDELITVTVGKVIHQDFSQDSPAAETGNCNIVGSQLHSSITKAKQDVKRMPNSGNTCYHSVQNLLYSRLLSENLKIRILKTINLPVVLYGYETWSLTLREVHRVRVFENRVLRRIL
jgi:hypothetical protein